MKRGIIKPSMRTTPSWAKTLYAPVFWTTSKSRLLRRAYVNYMSWSMSRFQGFYQRRAIEAAKKERTRR
jgi:hypothetical protein